MLSPVSRGFRSPIKWSGRTNKSIRPDHNIPFEMIPLKLKIDTKHRLLMLNTCNVDEYFQNTPADLRHISSKALLVHGPQIENHNLKTFITIKFTFSFFFGFGF